MALDDPTRQSAMEQLHGIGTGTVRGCQQSHIALAQRVNGCTKALS